MDRQFTLGEFHPDTTLMIDLPHEFRIWVRYTGDWATNRPAFSVEDVPLHPQVVEETLECGRQLRYVTADEPKSPTKNPGNPLAQDIFERVVEPNARRTKFEDIVVEETSAKRTLRSEAEGSCRDIDPAGRGCRTRRAE